LFGVPSVARLEDPTDAVRPLRRRDLRNLELSQQSYEDVRRLKIIRRMLTNRKSSSTSLRNERLEILKRLYGDLNLHELAELTGTDPSFIKREIEKES
jgi:hypothetical protein